MPSSSFWVPALSLKLLGPRAAKTCGRLHVLPFVSVPGAHQWKHNCASLNVRAALLSLAVRRRSNEQIPELDAFEAIGARGVRVCASGCLPFACLSETRPHAYLPKAQPPRITSKNAFMRPTTRLDPGSAADLALSQSLASGLPAETTGGRGMISWTNGGLCSIARSPGERHVPAVCISSRPLLGFGAVAFTAEFCSC